MATRATLVVLSLITFLGSADAFGGRGRGTASVSYGWPAPMWVMPASAAWICGPATAPHVAPLRPAPAIPYAPPRPAPPSETKEPPLGKTTSHANPESGPKVVESRSPGVVSPSKERCKVGFWNLLGRDVELRVGAATHKLPRDRAITLELDRQFTWSLAGRPDALERVPADEAFHEIILRKD